MLEGSEPRARSRDFSHSCDIPELPLQGTANSVYGGTTAEPEPEYVQEDMVSEVKKAVQGRLAAFARIGARPPAKSIGSKCSRGDGICLSVFGCHSCSA
eukprot:COSAG02_NODE_520_length_20751_cov_17.817112_8_plen_99_part_00